LVVSQSVEIARVFRAAAVIRSSVTVQYLDRRSQTINIPHAKIRCKLCTERVSGNFNRLGSTLLRYHKNNSIVLAR
jgi:hypothetical protein